MKFKKIEDIFEINDSVDFLFELAELININSEEDYHALSKIEKIILTIERFDREVQSGGLCGFLLNSGGYFAEDVKNFLYEIKAYNVYEAMNMVASYFPNNKIPRDRLERNEIIENLEKENPDFNFFDKETEKYYDSGENLPELVKSYLKPQIDEFKMLLKIS